MAEAPPSKEVPAPPVPVTIRYLPAFPAADGRLLRHPYIYGPGLAADGLPLSEKSPCGGCGAF